MTQPGPVTPGPGQPDSSNPAIASRRDMRKALVRMHMETHREALRNEAERMLKPMQRVHEASDNVTNRLRNISAPMWAGGTALLLGLIAGRRRKGGSKGRIGQLIRLGALLTPVVKYAYEHRGAAKSSLQPRGAPSGPVGEAAPSTWRPAPSAFDRDSSTPTPGDPPV